MELSKIGNITELKEQLGNELNKAATSFVRIGYLLKLARDTDILKDSSYSSVNEFASAEFGLDKTQVSRFIRINDRFAIGGYSETLKVEYNNYGSAKLSLMLTLPDEINEELSPEYSKSDIEAIKSEYEAEQRISDLEVMMEDKEGVPDEFLQAVVKQLNDENDDVAAYFADTLRMAKKLNVEAGVEDVKEAYMPDGDKVYSIRIPGQGRFLVSMKDSGITVTSIRAPEEKSPLTWEEFSELILADMAKRDYPEPEKPKQKPKSKKVEPAKPAKSQNEEVAPVQQCMDNAPQEEKTHEKDMETHETHGKCSDSEENAQNDAESAQLAAGEEDKQAAGADEGTQAAGEEAQAAAGQVLTSSQTEALQMVDEIRHMITPDDGSRPEWFEIYGKIMRLGSYVKQFTY